MREKARFVQRWPVRHYTHRPGSPPAEVHAEATAAANGRNIWVVGGGVVAAQWAEAGLLDEMLVTYMPVVLGRGAPLLPLSATRAGLTLERTRSYPSGALEVVYRF